MKINKAAYIFQFERAPLQSLQRLSIDFPRILPHNNIEQIDLIWCLHGMF